VAAGTVVSRHTPSFAVGAWRERRQYLSTSVGGRAVAKSRRPQPQKSEPMPAMIDSEQRVQIERLIEFASDVTRLADERLDLDLRSLVDDLHADLIRFNEEE
jgi:hypothetical protein